MKQYIKKALWIIPFVFSLNLSATDYEWIGGTSTDGSNLNNWEDPVNLVPPNNFTTAGDVFNFVGAAVSVDFKNMVLGNVTFKNSHPSIGVTVYNSGNVWIASSASPIFLSTMMTLDFSSGGTFIHTNPNITGYITSFDYYNLTLTRSNTIATALIVNGTLSFDSAANFTISSTGVLRINGSIGSFSGSFNNNGTLNLYGSMDGFSGTIYHSSTASFNIYSSATLGSNFGSISLDGGVWSDLRSTKNYPGKWIYNESSGSFIKSGSYDKIEIKKTSKLTDNTTILKELILNTASQRIELNGYTLTLSGIITGSNGTIRANTNTTYGNLVINTSNANCGTIYFTTNNNTLKDFTISNGAVITLGNALNLVGGSQYGTLTVNSNSRLNTQGFLTLKSTSNGTSRIGESNGVINGQYTVETYIPATGRKYRFLTSPVVNGTAAQWRNNGSSSSTASIGIQITGTGGSSNNFDNSTLNNPSAFWYDETNAGNDTTVGSGSSNDAGWTALSSGNQTLDNRKGYRVLIRGDRTISLTTSTPGTINPTTIWVKGTYPGYSASSSSSQPVVVNVTKTGTNRNSGINLIGNPYPSTIDWNAVTRSANVDAAYITYDPGVSGKGWTAASRYRGWNGSTGGAGRYIAAGQGFMVYTTGSGTVTFEESDKSTGAAGNFFVEKLTNHIIITMAYDSAYLDEAYLHFRDDASNNKDQFDLIQMINPTVNVATLDTTGQSYNINSLGKLEGKRVVPINLNNNPVADYKFKFNDLGTFASHRVYLNDKFTNKLFEVFEGNEYPISITSDPLSTGKNRLELVFEPIAANLKRIDGNIAINILNNPVTDILKLRLENRYNIGDANIEIFNTNGQLVLNSHWGAETKTTQINTSKLVQGIYFATITSKNYSQTIKFTKN